MHEVSGQERTRGHCLKWWREAGPLSSQSCQGAQPLPRCRRLLLRRNAQNFPIFKEKLLPPLQIWVFMWNTWILNYGSIFRRHFAVSPRKPSSKSRLQPQAARVQTPRHAHHTKATRQALGLILHFTFLVKCYRFLNVQKAFFVSRFKKHN